MRTQRVVRSDGGRYIRTTAERNQDMSTSLGHIEGRSFKDHFRNDVSFIYLRSGETFHMVHHTGLAQRRQRATIYTTNHKLLRHRIQATLFSPTNECKETTVTIAGYEIYWFSGKPVVAVNNRNGPDLKRVLEQIEMEDYDSLLLTILSAIKDLAPLWKRKGE